MTSPITEIQQTLRDGGIVILDGGTGTELERRGVPMHGEVWCGVATLSHGDVLRELHADYIRAGADIITVNTFSTNRNMLEPAGFGDRVAEINQKAVALALQARAEVAAARPIAVAGSMSHQFPIIAGTNRRDLEKKPTPRQAKQNFEEIADLLAEAGVDLLLMEMMSDPELAIPAIEAAAKTGLPVWVGLSCRQGEHGDVVAYSRTDQPFAEAVRQILSAGGEVVGVMHSNTHITSPALDIVRETWSGPLMAYPDSGYFKMPNWQFEDIIPPQDFAALCQDWIKDKGVQIVGGCCGLGVEHIACLRNATLT